jgi:hypothetical protein
MTRESPAIGLPYRQGQQEERFFKSRTHIAQIVSVDDLNGRGTVRVATTGEEYTLTLPLGGFSINGISSSWMRYMPQRRDHVKLTFGPDNRPEIVGYAAFGEEPDGADAASRQGGHIPKNGAYATVRRLAEQNVNGLQIFRRLRPGEWDMRSTGGAEIYGNRFGTLTLSGGAPAVVTLDKQHSEIRGRTGLTVLGGDGVEVRFGDVKRKLLPSSVVEEAVTVNPIGAIAPKEFSVDVSYKTPPLGTPTLTFYDFAAGDVRGSAGLPVAGPAALPLRARERFYDPSGLITTVSTEIDAIGNIQIRQIATALPLGYDAKFARVHLASSTFATLASDLPVGGVYLGKEFATEPFVKGFSFFTSAVVPWVTVNVLQSTSLLAFMTAFVACDPVFKKISGLTPAEIALLTAATTTATAAIAATTAVVSGGPTYTAAVATSLSLKIFGE